MTSQPNDIASVLQLVNREIWIVTARDSGRRGGLTATWVCPASIDRQSPVMLAGIAPNHFTAELVDASGAFALHLLAPDQIDLAWNFAIGSGRERDKLAGVETFAGVSGSPILCHCLAWLDCRVFARLPTGDRIYYWADVLEGGVSSEGRPLCEQELLARADDEQRALLRSDLEGDLALQRSAQRRWRDNMPGLLRPPG